MALCVEFDLNGTLAPVAGSPTVEQCQGYLLVASQDYRQIVLANNLFALPTGQDFATAWSIGFVLPVTLYLVAWAVASVVNMFHR